MGPLVYVMAIMGCGDAGDSCKAVRTLPTQYASVARCEAASEAALRDATDVDAPTVTVECRRADAAARNMRLASATR